MSSTHYTVVHDTVANTLGRVMLESHREAHSGLAPEIRRQLHDSLVIGHRAPQQFQACNGGRGRAGNLQIALTL